MGKVQGSGFQIRVPSSGGCQAACSYGVYKEPPPRTTSPAKEAAAACPDAQQPAGPGPAQGGQDPLCSPGRWRCSPAPRDRPGWLQSPAVTQSPSPALRGASCRAGDPGPGGPQPLFLLWLLPLLAPLGSYDAVASMPPAWSCLAPASAASAQRRVPTGSAQLPLGRLASPPPLSAPGRAPALCRLNSAAITILARALLSLLITLFPSLGVWRRPRHVSCTPGAGGMPPGELAAAQAARLGLLPQRSPARERGAFAFQPSPVPTSMTSVKRAPRPHFGDAETEAGRFTTTEVEEGAELDPRPS